MQTIRYNLMSMNSAPKIGGAIRAELIHRTVLAEIFQEDTSLPGIEFEVDKSGVVQAFTFDRTLALYVYTKREVIERKLRFCRKNRQIMGYMMHSDVLKKGILRK